MRPVSKEVYVKPKTDRANFVQYYIFMFNIRFPFSNTSSFAPSEGTICAYYNLKLFLGAIMFTTAHPQDFKLLKSTDKYTFHYFIFTLL